MRVSQPNYLFRRNRVYYFRWSIPERHRDLFNRKKELRQSLGTDDRRIAFAVVRRLLDLLDRDILERMRHSMADRDKDGIAMFLKLIETQLNGTKREWEAKTEPNDDPEQVTRWLDRIFGGKGAQAAAVPLSMKLSQLVGSATNSTKDVAEQRRCGFLQGLLQGSDQASKSRSDLVGSVRQRPHQAQHLSRGRVK